VRAPVFMAMISVVLLVGPVLSQTFIYRTTVDGRGQIETPPSLDQSASDTAPTVSAGPDQVVVSGLLVNLAGSGSPNQDGGEPLAYAWSQTGGPAVTLSSTAAPGPSFTAPSLLAGDPDVLLTFELVVTDNLGATSGPDEVTVTVTAPANRPPSANAGADQTVLSEGVITLNGSGSSDPDPGQGLTYAWVQTGGTAVILSNAAAMAPSFTAPAMAPGSPDLILTFSLVVTDSLGFTSAADSVTVTVRAQTDPCIGVIGAVCANGSVYAGVHGGSPLYTTPSDQGRFSWNRGVSNWTLTGATSTSNGLSNTNKLVSLLDAGAPYRAARACRDLGTDWYLPSQAELYVLFTNRFAIGGFNLTGALPGGWYWSSYEPNSDSAARAYRFSDGDLAGSNKTNALSVRCVRK
jgi:hypothetical protein